MDTQAHIRQQILNKVSSALQRSAQDVQQCADAHAITTRFKQLTQQLPAANPVAVSTAMSQAELTEHFVKTVRACSAQVEQFTSLTLLQEFLTQEINASSLPVFCEAGELLNSLSWPSDMAAKLSADYKQTGQLGILQAECAIAETGSVVLTSGKHHAVAAGFLVDTLIVLVKAHDIVLGLEDIWPLLNQQRRALHLNTPQRAVNIITGPSRTADVEQKVQLGAHGPRHLIVAVLNNTDSH